MTAHFLLFLSDIAILLLIGYSLGKIIDNIELVSIKKRGINSLFYMTIAFISGCWNVLTLGLPDGGIAINSILITSFTLICVAFIKSPQIREKVIFLASRKSIFFTKYLDKLSDLRLVKHNIKI